MRILHALDTAGSGSFWRSLGAMFAIASLATFSPTPVRADDVALTGSAGPGAATVELTLDELAAMPQTEFVTINEFSDGPVSYRGPLARDVVDRLGLGAEETLRLIAANDYYVEIPTSDFRRFDVIVALEADGRRLSRREKGPLWLMYPISDHEELQDPNYIHRLIWQLVRIEPA